MSARLRCLMAVTGMFHSSGGMAALNRLTVQAFAEHDCWVDIYSINEYDATIDERYISRSQAQYRVFGGSKLRFATALWKTVLTKRYDVVLFDHVNLASVLVPLASLRLTCYAVWLCGIEVFPPRPDFEGTLGLRYARKRLAISEYTRNSVAPCFPQLTIETCDLALDPVRHALSLPSQPDAQSLPTIRMEAVDKSIDFLQEQVVLHVGRMAKNEQYKGQDVLLQAFPTVVQSFPEAQLVLVGHGDDMPRLRALAESLPAAVQRRVFMSGQVDDVLLDQLYRRCYVFAMPSRGEGFGLVYLEAMSHAKACLGARADATPYVVRDRLTGVLVDDPRSSEEVGVTINWLLANPHETRQMGLAGYELVRSQYMFSQFSQRFWRAIQGG